jgi:hypothetical protein
MFHMIAHCFNMRNIVLSEKVTTEPGSIALRANKNREKSDV